RGLAALAGALVPGMALQPAPPPALDALRMPPPRIAAPPALAGFTGADRRERAGHSYGRGFPDLLRGFAGDFSAAPDLVARPRNEVEIEAVLDWAAGARVAVIPYGGGTSVVGGVEGGAAAGGVRGVLSLDLRALDRVLEIDPVSRAARIQAGATGPRLEEQLAGAGFSLRHYPQSFEFSTLGGWIATRAGGHFATVYTHIDDLVESVRMLTPIGPWESRRLPGSGAGPAPDRLVLGSEGTLGVITEAWMRLQPRPRWRASASVRFTDFAAAVAAVRELAQSGLHPANCRLLDGREAMLHRVTADGSCVLLLGFESADHPLGPWMERALAIAAGHGGTCPGGPKLADAGERAGGGEAATWRGAFFEMPYLFNAMVSMGAVVDTFETACTWDRFDALHGAVTAVVGDALRRVCGGGLLSCRFTHVYPDGPAPYYTFVAAGRAGAQREQWAEIKAAASDALLAAGGTITHHHAVGRLHRPWYERERPAPFAAALRAAKRALDPSGILNPGVLLDPDTAV
ncbi:MAG TPA: FAD-binding oxidoreductase, partial [Kofleriaceae bacterium]|nr:FAD-binding oxidoreductase [Kofleriaceae bacterium]